MARKLIGAVIAGLVVFMWSAVSHMVLPLGTMGMQSLPDEERLVSEMQRSISVRGLYMFPGPASARAGADSVEEAREDKLYRGPTGLLVFSPQGDEGLSPRRLLLELVSNIVTAFLATLLLARVAGGAPLRALFVGLMGVFGWLSISISYWNWYGFPAAFVLAEGVDQFVGWFLGGWVLALFLRRRAAAAATSPPGVSTSPAA
jgi:hypothetical protein